LIIGDTRIPFEPRKMLGSKSKVKNLLPSYLIIKSQSRYVYSLQNLD
jgi:hypothetical protein